MIRFRTIDRLRGTQVVSCYQQLLELNQSVDTLRALQQRRLTDILLSLKNINPLYGELLEAQSEDLIRGDPYAVLNTLPPIDKAFLTENKQRLFSPAPDMAWQHKKTGGSTGEPFRYTIDLASVSEAWGFTLYCWGKYAGYTPGDPYVTIAGSSLGGSGRQFKMNVYHALQNNYLIPGERVAADMQINRARLGKARLIFCYPSVLLALLDLHSDFFRGHQLKAVFTTSEQLLPSVRESIERRMGVPVFDMYGANDGGIISCECEKHEGFHYDPINCFVEEHRTGDGQSELLLTSLNSVSTPFVRYRVGDMASIGDFGSCTCGSPFPMIRDLSGRTRDMIRLPSGQTVHGVLFNRAMYNYPEIRRYRIVQHRNYSISVQVETESFDAWVAGAQPKRLQKEMTSFLPGVDIHFEQMLPLNPSAGKFKLIESHVS